jgi:fructose/tagatose bisphosphate aldolase
MVRDRHSKGQAQLDRLAKDIAFSPPGEKNKRAYQAIHDLMAYGVYPASIAKWYRAIANAKLPWITTPALNLRGITYAIARRVWRVAKKFEAGPIIFELAPSEVEVSDQSFAEYSALILAAAAREGYRGPVFLQGDHFDISSECELEEVKQLCRNAIQAGMYQIDIDASHLVNDAKGSLADFHRPNALATAKITQFIRSIQPDGVSVTLGGEVGEIGGVNTSQQDLNAFLVVYQEALGPSTKGLDKISAQTGTQHGGIVNIDGSIGRMNLDIGLIRELSQQACTECKLTGLVQHGASTLQISELTQLKQNGVIEVHLATGIQNIIFDHPAFPKELRERIQSELIEPEMSAEGGEKPSSDGLSTAQRFYNARWAAWGPFKRELWSLPDQAWTEICTSLDAWFIEVFQALGLVGYRRQLEEHYSAESR